MPETATDDGFTRVADSVAVREGRGHPVWLDGVKVAVFKKQGRYYAVADRCPHMGASLSEGYLSRGVVQCHWHNWRFDAETGRCEQKSWAQLATFDVRIEGDGLFLRPRPQAPASGAAAPGSVNEEDDAGDGESWMDWDPDAPKKN